MKYTALAKKILEQAKNELDLKEDNELLVRLLVFAFKKYDEWNEAQMTQEALTRQLIDLVVAHSLYTFSKDSLNRLVNSIDEQERKDAVHLDYNLTAEQADLLGSIFAQRFPAPYKEYLLRTLIEAKNTGKPPVRICKKPVLNKCPVCNSIKFKTVNLAFLPEGVLSHKICRNCGYQHKI